MLCAIVALASMYATSAGQQAMPDYPVRVTIREGNGDIRLIGRLTALAPESLTLRVTESDSVVTVERSRILRVERHHNVSIGKAAAIGCAALGATLGLLGATSHDPDSPGIEAPIAIAAVIVGCGLGGLGGAIIGVVGGQGWEEITL
jgi:hypothetical protein